jgi:hypothetical protein
MKMKLLKLLILGQFVLLTLGSASTPLWAAAVSQNEFWVSALPNPNPTPHAGTIDDPFDGSTRVLFDALFYPPSQAQLPANCTVHLLGGTFLTAGSAGFVLQTGQKIVGSGIDITTVKRDYASPGYVFASVNPANTGIEISDLTIDANAQNLTPNTTYGGIIFNGTGSHTIRRVKVQGLAHGDIHLVSETFGILANDQGIADRVVIEDCVIMPPVAGAVCTSICVGGSARVSGNWVYGTNTSLVSGIGIGNCQNTLVSGNHVLNADYGIRSECGNTNVTVVNNSFQNVYCGVQLSHSNATNQNFYFEGNTIELAYAEGACMAFSQSYTQICINEKIIGNTIKTSGTPGPSYYVLAVDSTTNLIVADNSIDSTFKWSTPGCTNIIIHENVDLFGNFLTTTNQTELPNSLTRANVTTDYYFARKSDRYVGVQYPGDAFIDLPSPTGISGKEYIIANETASGTVTIACETAHINGTSSVFISSGYGSKTVISDGSNWFAR